MADDELVNQDEIERLLQQGNDATPTPAADAGSADAGPADAGPADAGPADANASLGQDEIESLLGSGAAPAAAPPAAVEVGADDDKVLAQDDIEALLGKTGGPSSAPPPPPTTAVKPSENTNGECEMPGGDLEYLLDHAERALASINAEPGADPPEGVSHFRLEEFSGAPASTENATIDLIRDVDLDLRIELGRTHMYLEDILRLRRGSVVPLDKLAGDPVDIYANGRLIARGEVLVLNDNFCVRVAELISGTNVDD